MQARWGGGGCSDGEEGGCYFCEGIQGAHAGRRGGGGAASGGELGQVGAECVEEAGAVAGVAALGHRGARGDRGAVGRGHGDHAGGAPVVVLGEFPGLQPGAGVPLVAVGAGVRAGPCLHLAPLPDPPGHARRVPHGVHLHHAAAHRQSRSQVKSQPPSPICTNLHQFSPIFCGLGIQEMVDGCAQVVVFEDSESIRQIGDHRFPSSSAAV
jgi:hypothetical protein